MPSLEAVQFAMEQNPRLKAIKPDVFLHLAIIAAVAAYTQTKRDEEAWQTFTASLQETIDDYIKNQKDQQNDQEYQQELPFDYKNASKITDAKEMSKYLESLYEFAQEPLLVDPSDEPDVLSEEELEALDAINEQILQFEEGDEFKNAFANIQSTIGDADRDYAMALTAFALMAQKTELTVEQLLTFDKLLSRTYKDSYSDQDNDKFIRDLQIVTLENHQFEEGTSDEDKQKYRSEQIQNLECALAARRTHSVPPPNMGLQGTAKTAQLSLSDVIYKAIFNPAPAVTQRVDARGSRTEATSTEDVQAARIELDEAHTRAEERVVAFEQRPEDKSTPKDTLEQTQDNTASLKYDPKNLSG